MLDQARCAYHELMIGGSVRVFVDQNGERVEYTAANAGRLQSYISRLEAELNLPGSKFGPLNVYF